MDSIQRQIRVAETLDVGAVERALADLWKDAAAESESEDAFLRARAANLMVFLPDRSMLAETHQTIAELATIHPCRALVLTGDQSADTSDIEVYVSASCPIEKSSESRQLCCEEITLGAGGEFVSELPSAAIPLLLPDVETFLWWRGTLRFDDKVFKELLSAVDRLIVDSADFKNSLVDLGAVAQVQAIGEHEETAVSDINWERLTPWRASLATFYDVPIYRIELDNVDYVRIDYVAEESGFKSLGAQPLLVAGWLSSLLGWELIKQPARQPTAGIPLQFARDGRTINVQLNTLPVQAVKPGSIVRIELQSSGIQPATFAVSRSEDGRYLETSANLGSQSCPARRVRFKSRSTAELLSREMEILCVDKVYGQAIRLAGFLL